MNKKRISTSLLQLHANKHYIVCTLCAYLHTCILTCKHAHPHAGMRTHVDPYIYIYILHPYTHAYINSHIHSHIHTHIRTYMHAYNTCIAIVITISITSGRERPLKISCVTLLQIILSNGVSFRSARVLPVLFVTYWICRMRCCPFLFVDILFFKSYAFYNNLLTEYLVSEVWQLVFEYHGI